MAAIDQNLRLLLGSLLVGCYVEVFLQGILFVQINHYFHWYRDDRFIMKLVVAGLALLTTLKTCQSFGMLWIEFIESFADPGSALGNFFTNWTLQGNPLMVAASGLYIRAYFCYRLFVISKAWWTAVLVATTDLVALGFIAFAIHLLHTMAPQTQILMFFTFHFSFVFAGDLLLSLLTAFFLLRSKKTVLPQTQGFINALVIMTFETATPGAVCSLISLIFSQQSVTGFQVISAFNEIIPQLYAVSMMFTLNARHELRGLAGVSGPTTSPVSSRTRHHPATKAGIETVARGDVELGHFNVNVRKEMFTHIDASDAEVYQDV